MKCSNTCSETCAELVGQGYIPTEKLKPKLHNILTLGNLKSGTPGSSKLDAIRGSRLFFTTPMGLMGMAPPHVESGDLVCVLFGASLPFVLQRTGPFYNLIGEIYISDGYMEGRAIDEMYAGTRSVESFEIR